MLEIGAGTGYNGTRRGAGRVHSVDIDPGLVRTAGADLRRAGRHRVALRVADGGHGWPGRRVVVPLRFGAALAALDKTDEIIRDQVHAELGHPRT